MDGQTLQQAWQWLLSLSKVQLIFLGGGLVFIVAVSKTIRVLFLLSVVLLFLVFGLPQVMKYYKENPLPEFVHTLFPQDTDAAKDTSSADTGNINGETTK